MPPPQDLLLALVPEACVLGMLEGGVCASASLPFVEAALVPALVQLHATPTGGHARGQQRGCHTKDRFGHWSQEQRETTAGTPRLSLVVSRVPNQRRSLESLLYFC